MLKAREEGWRSEVQISGRARTVGRTNMGRRTRDMARWIWLDKGPGE
jgi:hypothetical protein